MSRPSTRTEILAALPPDLREPADVALDWLMPDEDAITMVLGYHVLHFAWYELPVKWFAPQEDLIEIARAVAAVMRTTGRNRLAELIESERTVRLHRAWRESRREGRRLLRESMDAAGFDPPDTQALVWSDLLGAEEAQVHLGCARMLEQAIDAGELSPGRSGWRQVQVQLVQAWWSGPDPVHGGRTPREVIHAERNSRWISGMTPDHYAALAPFLPLLQEPPSLDQDAAGPLRWLLTTVSSGFKLTQAGYLPPSIVEESKHWYNDWLLPGFSTRKEIDLPPLLILREWATAAKMIRVRKGVLELTPLGRSMLADQETFASATVTAWFCVDEAIARGAEVATAILLSGPAEAGTLGTAVHAALSGRFRLADGSNPSRQDCEHLLWEWIRPGNSLGFLDHRSGGHGGHTFTNIGRIAAMAGLVRRSHAPRVNLD